jgi:hypothetical protein
VLFVRYTIKLLDNVELEEPPEVECLLEKMPDLHPLSCGYEHAAVVRNSCLYTMGVSSAGCLGLGPLLTQSSPPKLVQTLVDLKVKVLSVSCGRKHTLALTDYGVSSGATLTPQAYLTFTDLRVGFQRLRPTRPRSLHPGEPLPADRDCTLLQEDRRGHRWTVPQLGADI